jgi:hypothetical protein
MLRPAGPRFAASEAPDPVSNPETVLARAPTNPTACLGVDMNQKVTCNDTKGRTPNWGGPILSPGHSNADATMSEDCLFLDIFVPVSAFGNAVTLPVVV